MLVKLPPFCPFLLSPMAAKPPATLDAPTVTLPEACEFVIAPLLLKPSPVVQNWQFCEFEPGELLDAKQPAVLLSPVITAPVANEESIVPWLSAAKPPADSHMAAAVPIDPVANECEICP